MLAGGATVLSFRSAHPFWIDAAAYAECLRTGRPVAHPPGYLLFLAVGRVAYAILRTSPYPTLQIITTGSYLASIPLLYVAMRRLTAAVDSALLTVAYAFSWVPLLLATVGTSHALDLPLGAALLALAGSGGFQRGRTLHLVGFFAILAFAAGIRPTTAIMWSPGLLLVLWHFRRRPGLWIGLALFLAAALVCAVLTVHCFGGWPAYQAALRQSNEVNAPSSLLQAGLTRQTEFNVARTLLWLGIQAGWLVPLMLLAQRREAGRPWQTLLATPNLPIWIAAGMGLGTAGILVLYLAAHPGYLTPLVPAAFVLAAAGGENLRLQGRERYGRALVAASMLTSLTLFFGARFIRAPATSSQALANGVLLQYSRDGVAHAVFHTTTEWLMLAGHGDLAPEERVDHVKRDQR